MEYQTIASEYVEYGKNKFLEVSKKKVKPDDTVFLSISKGYYTPDGEKRYQRGIGFPNESEIVEKLIKKLESVVAAEDTDAGQDMGGEEAAEEAPAEESLED